MSLEDPLGASPPVVSSFDINMARLATDAGYGTSPPEQFKPGRQRRPTRTGLDGFKQLKPFATADIKICTLIFFARALIKYFWRTSHRLEWRSL